MTSFTIRDLNEKFVYHTTDIQDHLSDVSLDNFEIGICIFKIHTNSTTYL
jgi:hypothetical protein